MDGPPTGRNSSTTTCSSPTIGKRPTTVRSLEPAVTDHLSSATASPPFEVLYGDDPSASVAPTGVIEDTCYRQVEFAEYSGTKASDEARQLVDFLVSSVHSNSTSHSTSTCSLLLMLSSTKCSLTMRSSQRLHQRSPNRDRYRQS